MGVFGILVQFFLFIVTMSILLVKKFMPNERRTWKVFLLDISKQVITSGFMHVCNLYLSMYLVSLTQSANGCHFYLINVTVDNVLGTLVSYAIFRMVDHFAVQNSIEVLKSGVYYEEKADLTASKGTEIDKHINYRIWALQILVWCMIVLLSRILLFMATLAYLKQLISLAQSALSPVQDSPKLELLVVMIFVPVTTSSVQYFIQDMFLKGDKHIDRRIEQQQRQ